MTTILRFTEACLLIAMGTFMGVLALSDAYWQFLNPAYSWLTLTSGVAITVVGFGCLFNTQRRRKVSELLGVVVFLGLAVTSLAMPNVFEGEGTVDTSLSRPYVEGSESSGEPTVTVDGTEYVKINVAELVVGEMDGWLDAGGAYAIQGAVVRTEELDQHGYIGVGRLMITCCFADSTGVVSLVKVDDPESFQTGAWVRAMGILEEGSPFPGQIIHVRGALTAFRSEKYVFNAAKVEPFPMDGVPFVFEIRDKMPFAF